MPEPPSALTPTASAACAADPRSHHGLTGTPPPCDSSSAAATSTLHGDPVSLKPDLSVSYLQSQFLQPPSAADSSTDLHAANPSATNSAVGLPANFSFPSAPPPRDSTATSHPCLVPVEARSNTTALSLQSPQSLTPLLCTPSALPRASAASTTRSSLLQPLPSSSASEGAFPLPTGGTSGRTSSGRGCASSALRLQTDTIHASALSDALAASHRRVPDALAFGTNARSALALQHKNSSSSLRPVSRTPSLKQRSFGPASAASSTVASPIISGMGDVTPLPSPLLSGDSPGPWKRLGRSPPSDASFVPAPASESALVTTSGESVTSTLTHQAKRKAYAALQTGQLPSQDGDGIGGASQPGRRLSHTRERSLSEYVPDPMQLPRRMVTVSASHRKPLAAPDQVGAPYEHHMRREPDLSESRGLTSVAEPPTPPPSESSLLCSDGAVSSDQTPWLQPNGERYEYFQACDRDHHKRRRWRAIRQLGQGTFSRVMLATSQLQPPTDANNKNIDTPSLPAQVEEEHCDRRALVAVKICEHGPKGGASEDRVEMSLKRELEIMQCIRHPSLVRLKAWSIEPTRAVLVLSYCPGGDLFDVASSHHDLLTTPLVARIFAELVGAVQYLHQMHIVHRDIKLENVLVNLSPGELANVSVDWTTYPYSVATLTDLGLSRRVADDEKLETRCGSDDYAAPEVIMGQPYDGRATDAWSLGVLLYALLESRLPFDPNPSISDARRMRSRTSHRIARVEWRWFEFAGDDGDHEGDIAKFRAKGLLGAMEITEGLLKRARGRWSIPRVAEAPWVRNAMAIPDGLRFREEEEGPEI